MLRVQMLTAGVVLRREIRFGGSIFWATASSRGMLLGENVIRQILCTQLPLHSVEAPKRLDNTLLLQDRGGVPSEQTAKEERSLINYDHDTTIKS